MRANTFVVAGTLCCVLWLGTTITAEAGGRCCGCKHNASTNTCNTNKNIYVFKGQPPAMLVPSVPMSAPVAAFAAPAAFSAPVAFGAPAAFGAPTIPAAGAQSATAESVDVESLRDLVRRAEAAAKRAEAHSASAQSATVSAQSAQTDLDDLRKRVEKLESQIGKLISCVQGIEK